MRSIFRGLAVIAMVSFAPNTPASSPTFVIDQIYSSADGVVQFAVLREAAGANGQTPNAFYGALPNTMTGACARGTVPVYRLWNPRADSNPCYTTSPVTSAQMVARGYLAEGYGPNAVALCVSP